MKIVHICLCGIFTDGFSYQDNLLSKYHAKMGHEVTFVAAKWIFDDEGVIRRFEKTGYFNEDGVYVIRLDNRKGELWTNKIRHFCGLPQVLEERKPDIIFVHGPQFMEMPQIVRYVKKKPDVKVYVDNHADHFNSAANWLSKNFLHKILWGHMARLVEPYAVKFYGVLPARVDFLKNVYGIPADRCELLLMGADDEEVERAHNSENIANFRKSHHIFEDDFLIMTGGKINTHRRQVLLLMEAVQKIGNPNVRLIVFGSVEPDLQESFHRLVDGLRVQYIGWADGKQSYDFFAAADLVVFPGGHSVYWEQVTGLGIPMICKYWEGVTHVDLGGNVEFLYEDSTVEIYEKIIQIAENPEKYQQMKQDAVEKGQKVFSYKKIAEKSIS